MGTKLQTIVPIREEEPKIDYHSRIVLLGSCFSENIGDKLRYFKFDAWSNPFGVIFNPYSIAQLLQRIAQDMPFGSDDTFQRDGIWCSFEVHSQWADKSQDSLIYRLNNQRERLNDYLSTTTHCIITLGTAWVYRYKATHNWVANCHKVPGTEFEKELLAVDTIVESLTNMTRLLKKINPKMSVIFTVSPVRHLKDGFVENNRSKGRLLDAIQTVVESSAALYFPSYEIMMDELRDYRFYSDDLLHPNALGVQYIWERFLKAWIGHEIQPIMAEIEVIQKALQHRPIHPSSSSHKQFLSQLQERIDRVQYTYPHIIF